MSKIKNTLAVLALAVGTLPLTSCAPNALAVDCQHTITLAAGYTLPDNIEWDTWPSGYASMNAGADTRNAARMKIQSLYPGAQKYVEMAEVGHTKEENNTEQYPPVTDSVAAAYILENSAANNETFKVKFTQSEWKQIASGDETVLKEKMAFVDPNNESKDTCASIKNLKSMEGALDANYFFNDRVNEAQQAFRVLQEIHQCNLYGKYDGWKCAGQDFVADWSGDSSITARNPFTDPYSSDTTQGLAEFTWCYNQGLTVNASRTGCE